MPGRLGNSNARHLFSMNTAIVMTHGHTDKHARPHFKWYLRIHVDKIYLSDFTAGDLKTFKDVTRMISITEVNSFFFSMIEKS